MRGRRIWRSGLRVLLFVVCCAGCGGDSGTNSGAAAGGEIVLARTPAGTVDTMVAIPSGQFVMGTNWGFPPEAPAHEVSVDAYSIDKYEVTNAQYRVFVQASGHRPSLHADHPLFSGDLQPVVGVSWADALAYCQWRGGRLPTEAEWEKAARGTDGRTYPWGEAEPDYTYAAMDVGGLCGRSSWTDPPSGPVEGEICHTIPVGSLPKGASPYGLLDVAGNVWEWCGDWYDETYYRQSPKQNPTGPDSGQFRAVRGSSWHHLPHYLEASARFRFSPDDRSIYIGFRCVQEIRE